jgi:hypothetical protein
MSIVYHKWMLFGRSIPFLSVKYPVYVSGSEMSVYHTMNPFAGALG